MTCRYDGYQGSYDLTRKSMTTVGQVAGPQGIAKGTAAAGQVSSQEGCDGWGGLTGNGVTAASQAASHWGMTGVGQAASQWSMTGAGQVASH